MPQSSMLMLCCGSNRTMEDNFPHPLPGTKPFVQPARFWWWNAGLTMWAQIKVITRLPGLTAFLVFVLVVHGNREALAQKTEDVKTLQKQVMELYQKGKYEQAI